MTFSSKLRRVEVVALGAAIALSGGFFLYKNPAHAILFSIWTLVGLLIMAPGLVLGALKQILQLVKDARASGVRLNGGARDEPPPPPGDAP